MSIREGKWDCKTCGQKGNRGPNTYCGACGSPRPDNVEFYLPDNAEEITDQALIDEAMSGADWICSYCSTQNNAFDSYCVACGNKTTEDQGNKKLQEKETYFDQSDSPEISSNQKPSKGIFKKLLIGAGTIAAAFIILAGLSTLETDVDMKVTKLSYESSLAFEEYKNIREESWSLPQGASAVSTFRAIHHYNKVPDGYVTKTRNVKVKVGERKVKVGKKDMGNGYFKDIYKNVPVYENRTEKYQEQVFRQVPVFMTKYRYNIMKWVTMGPYKTKGEGKNILFKENPDTLKGRPDTVRNIKTDVVYSITATDNRGNTYNENVGSKIWLKSSVNSNIKGTISTVFRYFKRYKE